MAVYAGNSFESGLADGAAITTGNSGGTTGRAFDVVDGDATYDAGSAAHGSLGALLNQDGNGRCQLQWVDGADTASTCWARFYMRATATPSSNCRILHFADHAGTQAFALQWRTNGILRLLDAASANMAESAATVPTGQWIRIEAKVVPSTTAGQAEVRLYTSDPDGDSPDVTITSAASFNTLTGFGFWRWGPTAGPTGYALSVDEVAVSFDDWLGPVAAPAVSGDLATTAAAGLTAGGHKATAGTGALAGLAVTAMAGRKVVRGSLTVPAAAELDVGGPGGAGTLDLAAAAAVAFHGVKPSVPAPPPKPLPKPAIDWRRRGRLYRYVFADLLTDSTLATLDLRDVTFDRRICQPGSFRGTVDVPNPQVAEVVQRIVPRDDTTIATGPGRTVVHIYRGESLWGTYIIWSANLQADDRGRISVELQGASLESYLDHREIRQDIVLTGVDQNDVARFLISHMQAWGPDSFVGIEVDTGTSGILRDRTYLASEAATYGQRLLELAQVIDGPEWMIRTWQDPDTGRRRREFIVGDRLGDEATIHTFAQPGNVASWSYPADATDAATSWQTRGDTIQDDVAQDSQPLLSRVWENPAYRTAGWPLLERTVDYQSVVLTDTLDAYARWWASQRSGMIRIPQATVRLPRDTDWSPNNLGNTVTLKLRNLWWPNGFTRSWRAIGCEVTPPSRDDGIEKMTIIFEEPRDLAASERINGAPPVPPPTPTGLHVTEVTSTTISLAWDLVDTADSYHLFAAGSLIASPTATSVLVDGLNPSTTYSFTIAAVNEAGASAPSAAVSTATAASDT